MTNDPAPPSPPSPPPIPPTYPFLPVYLKGTWQRDWRFGTELVDSALLSFKVDGLYVSGRRTNPLRGALWIAFRFAWAAFALALFLSLVLTSLGVTWRTCVTNNTGGGCDPTWVWVALALSVPALWITGWIVKGVARRFVEPPVSAIVPWSDVRSVATDGRGIDLVATSRFGNFRARMPVKARKARPLLEAIRERRLPGERGGETRRVIRSPWIDRGAGVGSFLLICFGALRAEPWLSGATIAAPRPEAAVPPAMTARGLDARQEKACLGSSGDNAGVRARRDGADLVWEVEGRPDGSLTLLRMKPGDAHFEYVGVVPATTGRRPGFYSEAVAGLAVLLAPGSAAAGLLASGRVEDLAAASCAGLVRDVALAMPTDAPGLGAERDGDDLDVAAPGLGEGGVLITVRRRAGNRGELFRWCEVATEGDDLGLLRAMPTPQTLPKFYATGADEALVYFVPDEKVEAAKRLALGGEVQRCLVPETLWASGIATRRIELTDKTPHALLRWRTGTRARAAPMFPAGASADAIIAGITRRYAEVSASLAPSADARDDFDAAFFDAVDWTGVFDTVRFGSDLARLETLRRGIAAVGGTASGTYALLRVGEAFLSRFPAEPRRYSARLAVGEAWLGAPEELGLQGDAAEAWNLVGRFVIADIGRRLEDDINGGRLGTFDSLRSAALVLQLAQHGVRIDIQPSTTRKVLVAWITGDFGYLADRVVKKLAELAGDSDPYAAARYSLSGDTSPGPAVRTARLLQDGSDIGWVALYDAGAVRARWVLGGDVPGTALLAMSAAYSESGGSTSGLTLHAGRVRNWLWKPDMGGLIVVGRGGGLTLLDMRRGGRLGGRLLRPGRSLVDLSTLLQTVQEDGGSAFQTFLLADDGQLRLNPDRASQTLRERRLLALARYQGNPIWAVIDLPSGGARQGYTLHQAADIAMKALRSKDGPGLTVEAVANLDTGAKNFVVARDASGRTVHAVRQPAGEELTNLLVFEPI